MTNPDARPATGTLPGYLSPQEAAGFADQPIGLDRLLSMEEEADMLAAGLDRERIANMNPETLKTIADFTVGLSEIFVGS